MKRVALVALLLISCAWGKSHTPHTKEVQLPRLEWSDDPSFTQQLMQRAEPVILTNSPAHSWDAIKWNPEYVSSHAKATLGIKTHTDPKFPVGCCPLVPMTIAQFWEKASNPPKGKYMYLNAQSHLVDAELIKEIGPKHFIELADNEDRMMNVWMGTKGTTAPLHYDPFENFFVQIYGRKRFYLFPPQQFHNVYLYPKTHAKHRQVQADINSDKNYKLHPNLKNAEGIEVELGPGDVMYLPPFWFHQVESLSAAISVNTWYNNEYVEKMGTAWDVQLPLSTSFSETQLGPVMVYFITRVIEGVYGKDSASSFFRTLVSTKYTPLYGHLASVDLFAHVRSLDDPHLRVHLREQSKIDASTFLSDPDQQSDIYCSLSLEETKNTIRADKEISTIFKKSVATLTEIFTSGPSNLRDMQIEDYVEDLIGQTVGDKNTYVFLRQCFVEKS